VARLKDQLTDMLSHDVRSPLTALEFSLALLLKESAGSLTDDGEQIVKTAQRNVTNLITLINQLLDLYKLDASRLQLNVRPTPLSSLIRSTLEVAERLAEAKAIDIEVEAPDEVLVEADADRVTQCLVNLVANAIKYSPENSTVIIRGKREAEKMVEIRISDQGPGIAPEHQECIFDRFYMAGPEHTGSTGLGLAITKLIIEAHGGTLGIDSSAGAGSSFWIKLPCLEPR
jgi:signal transduction histidine kinase